MQNSIGNLQPISSVSKADIEQLILRLAGTQTGVILQGEKGQPNGVMGLDANGLAPIARLPKAVFLNVVIVANDAERFALQAGDGEGQVRKDYIIQQTNADPKPPEVFFVKDENNLDNENGYAEFTFVLKALFVIYNNATSGLQATDLQTAIDEIVASLQTKAGLDNDNYVIQNTKAIKTILTGALIVDNNAIAKDDTLQAIISKVQTQLENLKAADTTLQTNKANNNEVVKLTGAQTIAGIKTFSNFPITPSTSPTANFEVVNKKHLDDTLGNNFKYQGLVVGEYKLIASSTTPLGWLLCNGQAVSRTTYSALFNLIGISFGQGNGSTTFTLPDFRGRVFGAVGQGIGLTNRAIGANIGVEKHTLTESEMPSHTHSYSYATLSGYAPYGDLSNPRTVWERSTIVDKTTGVKGSDDAHNNMQPTLFAGNVFIFAGV